MKNKETAKEQLINELEKLRQRVAELEKSELKRDQEFRALAENAPDIIAQFDKELRHIYVNMAIERATGMPRDSFIGKTNRELGMPENLITLWDKALQTVFETGQETTIEFYFPTPGGQGYFESRIVPEFAKDGSVESVLGISRNITERMRAEEELRKAKELSETLNKINEVIHSTLDFDELMNRVVNEARMALGSKTVGISLHEGDSWVLRYASGRPAAGIGSRFNDAESPVPVLVERTNDLEPIRKVQKL
ncbi:PAS domain S-box [Candidatus Methanoperedens nitroreducens]|uniref:histidine kinase n=1 Tax=Candidatus Methanoperedens nitratireducens TaxID=1392998 RepID=A0A062VBC5_9EURY|nr:PAS domain-containing protein [Candidatus Methanoperedens nitroreducens]KCZ72974.1 PAS domain S-box [Candidatus Methanoperedens nitroreducens]MDJ1423084.1 PAS domain-containing protein [Candidatus Methanoperedens sp.]